MKKSIERATDFLKQWFSDHMHTENQRLPSIRILAKSAFVSTSIMSEALKQFEADSKIHIVKGKGIYTAGSSPLSTFTRHPRAPEGVKWQRLKTAIAQDIINKKLSDDVLPGLSELGCTYGASGPTIRKALKALTDEGMLSAQRTQYKIRRAATGLKSTMVFVCQGENNTISIYNYMLHETLRALELECRSRNIALKKLILSTRESTHFKQRIIAIDRPLGYLVWSLPFDRDNKLATVLGALADTGYPVAILDEDGTIDLPLQFQSLRTMIAFTPAGRIPGRIAGRSLVDKGHRCMAYIMLEDTRWSRERLAGITESCKRAGLPDSACRLVFPRIQVPDTNESTHALQQRSLAVLNEVAPSTSWFYWPLIEPALNSAVNREYHWRALPAALDALLACKEITAIICENDYIALFVLRYLREFYKSEERIPVAVVGFDDIQLSSEYDLTSYHFSFANLVKQAIGFVLNPKNEIYWNKTRIEVEGIIMERGSTAMTPGPLSRL